MSFKQQHPMDIVHRVLGMEIIRQLGADVVKGLNPNLVKTFTEVEEDGTEVETNELDFEYMLFDAPIYQLELALKKLETDSSEKVSSLIGLDGKHMKYENPALKKMK